MTELFQKYFKGEASESEEKRLMDFVDSSEDARHQFFNERKLWDAYILHGDIQVQSTSVRRNRTMIFLSRIAAIFILALFTGWSFWLYYKSEINPGMQTVTVPPGNRVELDLPDGTKVWLNANSTFSYPLNFGKKERSVTLSGEGYFEINKHSVPFIVYTNKYQVEALGTTFNVMAYPESDSITTFLLDGSVKIHADENEDIILQPKEYLTYRDNLFTRGTVGDENYFLWRKGIIYFDDVPFPKMVEKLEQCYSQPIIIRSATAGYYRCTGKFRQTEGIDHILRVLQKDVDFNYFRLDDENQTIIIQ